MIRYSSVISACVLFAGITEAGNKTTFPSVLEQGGSERRKERPQAVAAADRQAGKSSARPEKEVGYRALTGAISGVALCAESIRALHVLPTLFSRMHIRGCSTCMHCASAL